MKLTTILVTIALCFSAFSAEYASIDQAYAARDYSYIVNNASTNSNSNIKIAAKFMKAQKWNDAEKTALADAYSNVSIYVQEINLNMGSFWGRMNKALWDWVKSNMPSNNLP